MNDTYSCEKLRKYSTQVESIAVYDDYLVVGNRQGNIFWYKTNFEVNLLYREKKFHGKPIIQLAAIPHLRVVVCLSGERGVSVLELVESQNGSVHCNITDVLNTKGARCFAINVKTRVEVAQHGDPSRTEVRLCVANKKQLQIYLWNGSCFSEQYPSVVIKLDVPRTLLWCDHLIVIGCKNEYYLVDVNTKQLNHFILTGKCREPIIVKISDTTFGIVKDSQLIITSTMNNADEQQIIRLNDTPSFILYDAPYLLVSIGQKVYVRTIETFDGLPAVRQEITTDSKITKMFSCKNGLIYASSAMDIWRLTAIPFIKQIKRILDEKNFPLALKLAKISDESIKNDEETNEIRIRKLYAEDLFKKKKYHESMKEFLKLNIDPYKVIGIFPSLLPHNNSDDVKEIVDEDTTMRVIALIDYLTEVRRKVSSRTNFIQNLPDIGEEIKNYHEQLFQIIDTTLLKCYLQTNDAMIAPLVRLNKCHFMESEATLRKYKKYNELVILYQVKGLHRKALELLKNHSDDSESSVNGPGKTIQYLQNLDTKHIDLIWEFSHWVLNKYPDEGLDIFTEDIGNVEQFPKSMILKYLKENHEHLVVPYLERVIRVWDHTDFALHDELIYRYTELIQKHESEPTREADAKIVRNTKDKLLSFLRQSNHYNLEKILKHFPIRDGCFEERVIVLEKLGRHEQALSIYIYKLNDIDRATEYCNRVYASRKENSNQIYVTLLKLLNDPTDSWLAKLRGTQKPTPDLEKIIKILNKYATIIPFSDVIGNLPDDIPIHRIRRFLVVALETVISDKRRNQLSRGLLRTRYLQMRQQKIHYESQRVTIEKCDKCSLCENLFESQSAFVRYPDGKIAHLSCHIKLRV